MTLLRHLVLILAMPVALAGCGGDGEVIVVFPGDGQPVEAFYGMDAADLNGDGFADIAAMSTWYDGQDTSERRLNVFLQDASSPGTFMPPDRSLHEANGEVSYVRLVDLDLDGTPSLVTFRRSGAFYVYEPDLARPGTFLDPLAFDAIPVGLFAGMAVADVDGDLYPDVATVGAQNKRVAIYRQLATSPPSFMAPEEPADGEQRVVVKDVNGDGFADLVTFQTNEREEFGQVLDIADTVLVHLQQPANPGQYAPPVSLFFDKSGTELAVADLNGDGLAEIVVHTTDALVIYRQVSPVTFARSDTPILTPDSIIGVLAIADLDADSVPEIVLGSRTGAVDPNTVEIFAQDIGGDYVSAAVLSLPIDAALAELGWHPQLFSLRLVDLNGDNYLDIAVSTYELFVFFQRNTAPGAFGPAVRIAGQR